MSEIDSKLLKEIAVTIVLVGVLALAANWVTGENFIDLYTGVGVAIGLAIGIFIRNKLKKK